MILLITSLVLVGFHFQDSCQASCGAFGMGVIFAGIVAVVSFVRKKKKMALLSVYVILAHMLLVH
jgi:hypothetical protein